MQTTYISQHLTAGSLKQKKNPALIDVDLLYSYILISDWCRLDIFVFIFFFLQMLSK